MTPGIEDSRPYVRVQICGLWISSRRIELRSCGEGPGSSGPGVAAQSPGYGTIFLGPVAAGLMRTAISRTCERSANAKSPPHAPTAESTHLVKLELVGKWIPPKASTSMSHMNIVQPFSGSSLRKFFSLPTNEKQIAALRALGRSRRTRQWPRSLRCRTCLQAGYDGDQPRALMDSVRSRFSSFISALPVLIRWSD
jgi:hypothetical protein